MIPRALLYFLFFVLPILSFGQNMPENKKAKDAFEKAEKAFQERQFQVANSLYEKVVTLEPNYYPGYIKLAQLSELQRNHELTEKYYQKAINISGTDTRSAIAFHWLGRNRFQKEKYDSAYYYFQKAIVLYPQKSNSFRITEHYLKSAEFALTSIKNPLNIKKEALSDTVNFLPTQYFPVLTADNETLLFTGQDANRNENIYITHQKDGKWQVPEGISNIINSDNNEGTCSISADGNTLVFTACNRQNGFGSCDLYISKREGTAWSEPKNMGQYVNSHFWESQPSLSADGHTLYFASERKNGLGKKDIWITYLQKNGIWTEPINAGSSINTAEDETAPFIHANNQTLFFSSNGYPGLGGYDIFLSNLIDTSWTKPVNLGYPINTFSDQVGMFVASDGKRAYYTDDIASTGNSKIYTFLIPESIKNQIITTHYAKGKVIDSQTKQALRAEIMLVDLEDQKVVSSYQSDVHNGQFLAVLNKGKAYAFYVEKKGYLFKSMRFSVQDSISTVNLEIPLEKIVKNKKEILNNIFFKSGSAELDQKSKVELSKLLEFLQTNETINITISGFTDDVGSDATNLDLSQLRAENVVNYITQNKIDPKRLTAQGFGKAMPVVPNTTEENRQKNRRIEWSIQ